MKFVGWGKMKTHEFRVGSNNYLICVRPGEKRLYGSGPWAHKFRLAYNTFFYFSFFGVLITNKVIIHGKQERRLQSFFY